MKKSQETCLKKFFIINLWDEDRCFFCACFPEKKGALNKKLIGGSSFY